MEPLQQLVVQHLQFAHRAVGDFENDRLITLGPWLHRGTTTGRLQVADTPLQLRQAMEDTWGDVLVQRRWQRLASRLGAADCELLLQRASKRGLVVGGGRWMSADAASTSPTGSGPPPHPQWRTRGGARKPGSANRR